MPIFDFKCLECETVRLDVMVKMNQDTIECPNCMADMQKKLSAPNFKLGKSFFVKPPTAAEQKSSEWIMQDYVKRSKGELQ